MFNMQVDRLYCECVLLMEVIGSCFEEYVLHEVDRLYCECALLMEVTESSFEQYVLHKRLIIITVNVPY